MNLSSFCSGKEMIIVQKFIANCAIFISWKYQDQQFFLKNNTIRLLNHFHRMLIRRIVSIDAKENQKYMEI